MYKLTENDITKTEAIYLCIKDGTMSGDTLNKLMDQLRRSNIYAYIYLEWLCTRWCYICPDKLSLPRRSNNIISEKIL